MKRPKYYDFLWNWDNAEKGNEFENKIKEYLAFLTKDYSEVVKIQVPDKNQPYKEGYLIILNGAIKWLERILDSNYPQNDCLSHLLFVKNTYHERCLLWKKIKYNEYVRGQLRAGSDLYKGIANLTQSMIEFQQNTISGKGVSHATPALITKPGSTIVLDFKGETFHGLFPNN